MDFTTLEKYAHFAIRAGVNLQKGQVLIIGCPVEAAHFARMCAAEAFAAGARDVVIHYNDEQFSRIRIEGACVQALQDVKPWVLASYMDYHTDDASVCRLAIYAEDPEIFLGLDLDKVDAAGQARSRALKPWTELTMAHRIQWCVLSIPTRAWAKRVFPTAGEDEAVEKLWQAIVQTGRMDTPDPVAAWKQHAEAAAARVQKLNSLDLAALHLTGENGTDLTVGLVDDYLFEGIGSRRADGLPFYANVPSEELFTAPHKNRVSGVVKSSLPYVYNGNLIEGIAVRFEAGVAVEATAAKGEKLLRQLLETDEGARRLGEIALVPSSSPVRKTGLLFYNTLFDENAASHMAFGAGYPLSVKNGAGMSRPQLDAKGLNDSLIHEDVMIGTPAMTVTGITRQGGKTPLMEKGEWVL